jgi:hypothetical protein
LSAAMIENIEIDANEIQNSQTVPLVVMVRKIR